MPYPGMFGYKYSWIIDNHASLTRLGAYTLSSIIWGTYLGGPLRP